MNEERENVVKAYQDTFNTESGALVLEHLSKVARMDDCAMDTEASNERIRALHYLRCTVNYMKYMRDSENFIGPEGESGTVPDLFSQTIENEI
jgi:hypothetical protein